MEVNQDRSSDSDEPLAAVVARRGNAVVQLDSIGQHAIAEPSSVGPTVAIRSSFR